MASGSSTQARGSSDRRLAEVVEEFAALTARGARPDVEEFVARLPTSRRNDARDALEGFVALVRDGSFAAQGAAVGPAPTPGNSSLGGYRIVREIGRGGMGVVYEALDLELERRVALKLLPPLASLDPRFLERFRREARAAAGLRHPNIVPVHGEGHANGLFFFVMQYVEGESLDRLVQRARERTRATVPELSYKNIARIGRRIAEALSHAHGNGVLHRDVKSGNVLLDRRGHVWVTDFGLCKAEGADELTRTGAMVGTLNYMAPEQVDGASDVRSDVYGLGATLYELVTLRRPFQDASRSGLVRRVLNEEPTRPRRLASDVPRDLESIVLKAMAKLPEHRYGTTAALADDLHAFLESRPVRARPPGLTHLAQLAWRRNRLLVTLVAAIMVALPVLGLLYLRSMDRAHVEERRRLYLSEIAAADATRLLDPVGANEHLERAPVEHRNWEWHHLRASVDQSLGVVESSISTAARSFSATRGGNLLAVASDHVFLIRDGVSQELEHFDDFVYSLDFDPTGTRLAAFAGTGEVVLWDLTDGVRVAARRRLDDVGNEIVFSDDGRELLAVSRDPVAHVLEADGLTTVRRLRGHHGWIRGGAFASGGDVALTAGLDGTIRRWELASGRGGVVHESVQAVEVLAVEGVERVAFGTEHGNVGVIDLATQDVLWAGGPHSESVSDLVFAGGGCWVLSASLDGSLALHDAETGSLLRRLTGHSAPIVALDVLPDGVTAFTIDWFGEVREWDLEASGGSVDLFGCEGGVTVLAFSPDGRELASASIDGVVRFWDGLTGRPVASGVGHTSFVRALAYSPTGDLVVSCGVGGDLLSWPRVGAPGEALTPLASASAPGRLLALGFAGSERPRLWLAVPGRLMAYPPGGIDLSPEVELPIDELAGFRVGPDSGSLAAFGRDGRVHWIDADRARISRTLQTGSGPVRDLAFTRRPTVLATRGDSPVLQLWTIPAGVPAGALEVLREEGEAWRGPDPWRLLVTSFGRGISLADADGGGTILRLDSAGLFHCPPAIAPDGTRVASGNSAGHIRIWDTVGARERHEYLQEERSTTGRSPVSLGQRKRAQRAWIAAEVRRRLTPGTTRREWAEAANMAFGLLRGDVNDPETTEDLGHAYLLLGNDERAIYHFRRAVALRRSSGDSPGTALALLSRSLARTGDLRAAEEALAEAEATGDAPDDHVSAARGALERLRRDTTGD